MRKAIVLGTLILALGLMNWSIAAKERHLADGAVVYLQLAPVDPRSLMQGDYMALSFDLSGKIYAALPKVEEQRRWRHDVNASDGAVVVVLDERRVASYVRLHHDEELSKGEMLLSYRVRGGAVKFATNAFFFQEGDAELYQPARFGEFRVDSSGELLLVSLVDKNLSLLGKNET